MTSPLSLNTQAILLLTAPLIAGRSEPSSNLLTPTEYKRLFRYLQQESMEPAKLLSEDAKEILRKVPPELDLDIARIERLLARGFALSQAIDRWQTRAIWVVSHADQDYPQRFEVRLIGGRPTVLYGCGDRSILDRGGLAVVGSRQVDEVLIEYTLGVGRLAAKSRKTIVSGGARGIDQAAMRGALESGGTVAGVMAGNLEKTAMNRENRNVLMDGQLVLVSPYDPGASFQPWQAMQRNKLIYALADAALVVNSDLETGGTWEGAVEQLNKFRFVPVYVRSDGLPSKALEVLQKMGAHPWPNPVDSDEFIDALMNPPIPTPPAEQQEQLSLDTVAGIQTAASKSVAISEVTDLSALETDAVIEPEIPLDAPTALLPVEAIAVEPVKGKVQLSAPVADTNPADALFAAARQQILKVLVSPKKLREIAYELRVAEGQVKAWLEVLVEEESIVKKGAAYQMIPAAADFDLSSPNANIGSDSSP